MTDDIPPRAQLYQELCGDIDGVIMEHANMYTLTIPEILGCLELVKTGVIGNGLALDEEDRP
jgi:hypothetical protein